MQSQSNIALGVEQNSGIPNSAILRAWVAIEKGISHIDACGKTV